MENLTDEQANEVITYFSENVLNEDFNEDRTVFKMVMKNDADIDKALLGAEQKWYAHGDYPSDFKGIVVTEDGSKSRSFDYEAPVDPDIEYEVNEYDVLHDFKEFWADDVAKKFNENKEVEFIVRDGVDVMKSSKLIFDFINESTRLGADITVILIDSMGERTNLLVQANKNR